MAQIIDGQLHAIWGIEDVQQQAKDSFNIELSEDDALLILRNVADGHDAGVGINWDVLDCRIDEFMQGRVKS